MTKYKTTILVALILISVVAISGCAGDPEFTESTPAGFWSGLWHGMIGWITLIMRAFGSDIQVYEVANNGGWYDWGFLCGASGTAGGTGGSISRRRS